jgi:hypothetical protein
MFLTHDQCIQYTVPVGGAHAYLIGGVFLWSAREGRFQVHFGKIVKVGYLFRGFATPNKYGPCPGTHKYGYLLKMAMFEKDI